MHYFPNLHVVLYEPEIPQNTGNIGRTCVATGAKLWLVRPLGFRLDDHHLRRAALDYWNHLEWEAVDDWNSLTTELPTQRTWFFSKSAGQLYTSVRYRAGDALVFGSETRGMPKTLLAEQAQRTLQIPTRPQVRSLNLASVVAVVVFEAVRQIRGDEAVIE